MPEKKEKRQFIISLITAIIIIFVMMILIIMYLKTSEEKKETTFENLAKTYCNKNNVESVSICNGQVIEIKSSLLGGGSTYHHKDNTTFTCPIVSQSSISPECRAISNAKKTNQWNCIKIC